MISSFSKLGTLNSFSFRSVPPQLCRCHWSSPRPCIQMVQSFHQLLKHSSSPHRFHWHTKSQFCNYSPQEAMCKCSVKCIKGQNLLTRFCCLLPWHIAAHTFKLPFAVITTDPCQLKHCEYATDFSPVWVWRLGSYILWNRNEVGKKKGWLCFLQWVTH